MKVANEKASKLVTQRGNVPKTNVRNYLCLTVAFILSTMLIDDCNATHCTPYCVFMGVDSIGIYKTVAVTP